MSPPTTSFVSVCLPVFNGEKHLPAAIESILAQSHANFELLVSDDGSSDASTALIAQYASADTRVKPISAGAHLGLFGNYNFCLSKASGQFVKPFAQDDILNETFLQRCVEVLTTNPDVALVSTARKITDAHGTSLEWSGNINAAAQMQKRGKIDSIEVFENSLFPVLNFIGEPVACMFRRKHVGTGFDTRFNHLGDLDYWLRLLANGNYFYIDEALCQFRRHGDSQSNRNESSLSFAPDILLLKEKYKSLFESLGRSPEEFVHHNIKALALSVRQIAQFSPIDLQLDSAVATAEQALNYKELFYHSLMYIAEHNDSLAELMTFSELDNLRRSRERELHTMLASKSWSITRPLRELNRRFIARPSKAWSGTSIARNNRRLKDLLEHQRTYLQYLRKQIITIRSSRSWKLTAPLRRS